MMKNNRGFTLIEILLAAMIVGLIGLSLGAISTAALRESGVGRTRMIMRNQLSLALRQLRQDIHEATTVTIPSSGGSDMLVLTYDLANRLGKDPADRAAVIYTLKTSGATTLPDGSTVGNEITRTVRDSAGNEKTKSWLENVKIIAHPSDSDEKYPSFQKIGEGNDSRIIVRLIVQPSGEIVINETVRTVIVAPQGGYTTDPCFPGASGTCEL